MGNNTSTLPDDRRTARKELISALEGFTKGFCVSFIPTCLLKRRVTGIRRALALGTFCGGFRAVTSLMTELKRRKQMPDLSERLQLAISSAISMTAALVVDGELHLSSILVNWFLVRGIRTVTPEVPYGATIIVCIAASQLISTWLQAPDELHPSYIKFMNFHSGQTIDTLRILQNHRGDKLDVCSITHPGKSHLMYNVEYFISELKRAIPTYLPLYLIFYALSKHKNKSIIQLMLNVLRSSIFLTTICGLGWASGCVYYPLTGRNFTRTNLFSHSWVAGLATLIERPNRRKELAAYGITYAIDSVYTYLRKRGYLGHPPAWVSGALMVISLAMMMYRFDLQPGFITKWLLNIDKDKVLGIKKDDEDDVSSPRQLRHTT